MRGAGGSLPGAADQRQAAFDAINVRGAETLTSLLTSSVKGKSDCSISARLGHVEDLLSEAKTPSRVLCTLDANHDGQVTFGEILSYDRNPSTPLGSFLAFTRKELQIGAGNEDISRDPGVRLSDLGLSQTGPTHFALSIGDGTSQTGSSANGALPAVQLNAFCDGSVRFLPSIPLDNSPFTANLTVGRHKVMGGTFTIVNPTGLGDLSGILLGVRSPQEDRSNGDCLNGIVLVTGGSGALTGASGIGHMDLQWDDSSLNGPFGATMHGKLPTPAQSGSG